QKYLDHLGACSPCYRDFLELQAKYRQRRTRMILAVAAGGLIVVGLGSWAVLRRRNKQIVCVVDLWGRAIARGAERPPSEPPLGIPRNVSHLDIYLPLGSSEGAYDVRVTSATGESLVSEAGQAKIERGLTVLRVDIRISSARPGHYILQIRRHGSD